MTCLAAGGKDRLEGDEGRDTLIGGKGADKLAGGGADDVFLYERINESRPDKADVITALEGADRIDTFAIDANKLVAGNQDFVHVAALTGVAGQLAYSSDGAEGTIIEGDVDGDAIADFRIEILRDSRDSLQGTAGDDTLIGYDENEVIDIRVSEGNDVVLAGGGDDRIEANFGDNTLDGGAGDDTIIGIADTVIGGDGNDSLRGSQSDIGSSSPYSVDGGAGDDTMHASCNSTVIGGAGNDSIIWSEAESNTLGFCWGGDGDDTLTSNRFDSNSLEAYGGGGADSLSAGTRNDTVDGGAGNDTLMGGEGADLLLGGTGDDVLDGGEGEDVLIGGAGADVLEGGKKPNTFKYESVNDSAPASPDLITKLNNGMTVDLSAIDADTATNGDQAFNIVPDFSGSAGQLRIRYEAGADLTFIEGDVNGDGIVDLTITTKGNDADFTSFIL